MKKIIEPVPDPQESAQSDAVHEIGTVPGSRLEKQPVNRQREEKDIDQGSDNGSRIRKLTTQDSNPQHPTKEKQKATNQEVQ
jgi:hypothetical protein